MIKIQKSKVFQDEKCTCNCGNTHEFYGGKGYKTIDAQGYTDGKGGGLYFHQVKCNKCGEIHTLRY